eukprot:5813848-Pyramimonas_sp.AAC.1
MDGRLGRLYMGEPSCGRPPTRGRGGAFRAMRIEPAVSYGFSIRHPSPGPEEPRGSRVVTTSHYHHARDHPIHHWH